MGLGGAICCDREQLVSSGEVAHTFMDPFSRLGLTQSASSQDVKLAFRKLALELHPDRCARAATVMGMHAPQLFVGP